MANLVADWDEHEASRVERIALLQSRATGTTEGAEWIVVELNALEGEDLDKSVKVHIADTRPFPRRTKPPRLSGGFV